MKEIGHITLSIVLGVLIVSNNNCRGDRLKHTVDAETIMKRLTEGSNGMTPTVKDFDLEWVRTLTQRGEPTVYTKQNSSNFEYIGMPIGGIATGQLYLGGDGKLWYWDIFNNKGREHVRGVETYRNPYKRSNVGNSAYNNIQQGFAIRMFPVVKHRCGRSDSICLIALPQVKPVSPALRSKWQAKSSTQGIQQKAGA